MEVPAMLLTTDLIVSQVSAVAAVPISGPMNSSQPFVSIVLVVHVATSILLIVFATLMFISSRLARASGFAIVLLGLLVPGIGPPLAIAALIILLILKKPSGPRRSGLTTK